MPSTAGYKLEKTIKYEFESDTILYHILHTCATKEDNQLNRSGDLWKAAINFSVPIQEEHEFWKQSILTTKYENDPENSTLLQMTAYGSSKQEAESFAVTKLINSLQFIRRALKKRCGEHDIKAAIPKLIDETVKPTFPDRMSNPALKIGDQLFTFYSSQDYGTRIRNHVWKSIENSIQQHLKECSSEVQPLLKYYLVILSSFSSAYVDLSYDSTRQTYRSVSIHYFLTETEHATHSFSPALYKIGRDRTTIVSIWIDSSRVFACRGTPKPRCQLTLDFNVPKSS